MYVLNTHTHTGTHTYIHMYILHIVCKNINIRNISTVKKKKLAAFTEEDTGTKLITENKVTRTINQFNCLRYTNNNDVYSEIERLQLKFQNIMAVSTLLHGHKSWILINRMKGELRQ